MKINDEYTTAMNTVEDDVWGLTPGGLRAPPVGLGLFLR